MEIINEFRHKIRSILHKKSLVSPFIEHIEVKTKVNREYLFYGTLSVLVLTIAIDLSNFLCYLIGTAYPCYASIKAIESPIKKNDTKWLMYWCVFSIFGILEYFSDYLLFWIPFYSLNKCIFLIWLMMSGQNSGTNIIYNNILRPFMNKHQNTIENTVQNVNGLIFSNQNGQSSNKNDEQS